MDHSVGLKRNIGITLFKDCGISIIDRCILNINKTDLKIMLARWLFISIVNFDQYPTEAYSKHNQTSKLDLFEKVVNGLQPSTIFAKAFILDAWLGSECTYIPDIAIMFSLASQNTPKKNKNSFHK